LDRMELSMKNNWVDGNNRVYIYFTIENIMEVMGWGNKKSVKVLSELDTEKGIGLIEKQRQGQGKPTKIYVKNFIVDNFYEMSKGQGNNTNINNTEFSDTNPILSLEEKENRLGFDRSRINKAEMYRDIIYKNIEYDHYKRYGRYSIDDIDNIVELMVDVCVQEGGTVPINGNHMPVEVVKSRFLKLSSGHIEYIMNSLEDNPSEVRNIRNYLLTTIYNAANTMSQYYRSLVNYNENG
ncbi:MAG: replication initiator A domain-containing protein, partial [Tissierellia bacterium]|nr:replication initiator A domain-containing protein [Tissierellia bacterium]